MLRRRPCVGRGWLSAVFFLPAPSGRLLTRHDFFSSYVLRLCKLRASATAFRKFQVPCRVHDTCARHRLSVFTAHWRPLSSARLDRVRTSSGSALLVLLPGASPTHAEALCTRRLLLGRASL